MGRQHHSGRGAPLRGFHAPPHHAPYAPYAPPAPPLPPPGGPPFRGPDGPPPPLPPPPPPSSSLERDVAAFLNALRASRSDASAPPNALHVQDAIQAICAQFGGAAYDALVGASRAQLPPPLRALATQHERVWHFVTCYRHARRLHTLYECHEAFLQHEGIRHFKDLGIGNSFVHTDAVQTLYHAPSHLYRLTTRDIVTAFRQFEHVVGHDAFGNRPHAHQHQRIDLMQFKQFLAQQRRQPSAEAMGVYIDPDGFGPYIAMLRRVAKKEQKEIHDLQEEFNKGIADRVFELSKEKFSAENRQQALQELLARTNESRASEAKAEAAPKKKATTLASLSLEMLNRVTDVDVFLDTMLRWKSADEKYQSRLAANAIAETDRKIRTQLSPFLLATQKSRHHARVKVVTWVLCGVLAKIHTLLQLDDKIPEATPGRETRDQAEEKEDDNEDDEDDGEECDCCCVGEDTCRCRCDCECHRDDSDSEEKRTAKTTLVSTASEASSPAPRESTPAPRKSVAASLDDIKVSLERFLTEQTEVAGADSAQEVMKLLAKAERHVRSTFGERIGDFSLLEQVVEALEATDDAIESSALRQITANLRPGHNDDDCVLSRARVHKEDVADFVATCVEALPHGGRDDSTVDGIVLRACTQFGLDVADDATRRWVKELTTGASETEPERRTEGLIIHYAGALALSTDDDSTHALALLQDDASRDQVIATKTAAAQKALGTCPYLVDVAQWTRWRARFEPFCGPLRAFLRTHDMIRNGDDHAIVSGDFVWCTNDQVVKIRRDASASALDVAELSPETLALELVSLFMQHRGSTADFPRELVLLHVRSMLKRLESERLKTTFVLDAMLSVPHDFAALVWGVLHEAARPAELEGAMPASCASQGERRQLQLLGEVLSKDGWKTDASQAPKALEETVLLRDDRDVAMQEEIIASEPIQVLATATQPRTSDSPAVVRLDAGACEAFIDRLRREQFGIGLDIADDSMRAVLQAQHRRLERALKRLSDELYSEKTHFVLELLQNADDNAYPRGVVPRGEFVLTADGTIVFANNETGFGEKNIQAICDVGASTKEHETGDQQRSIGKKGIGFKSVFKVSDTPQVHSNGFHIQFHAHDEHVGRGLGYILPYWIDDRAQWKDADGTTFVLPLNAHSLERQREISDSLLAFEPSVLLFLQKIRELRLRNDVTGGRLAYQKHEHVMARSSGTTVTKSTLHAERGEGGSVTATTEQWFILRRRLEIPSAFAERGTRTEIAIAVPDFGDDDGDADDADDKRPPLQQVFCYLPLRSYGFRFIVQGDFDVPSSREAISNGSDWNQWLISQYPSLVPSFVGLVQRRHLSLRALLRVLPLDSDVQAPFRSIVADLSRELRRVPCFPSVGTTDACRATDVLDVSEFADDSAIDALAPELVDAALDKRVLEVEVARTMPPLLKAQLRIERLRASHVLRLLSHVAAKHNEDAVLPLLHLLAKLVRHDRHRSLVLQELRRVPCFPVQTGATSLWVALTTVDSVLFLRSMRASATTTSLAFVDELCVLSDAFTSQLETSFPDTRRFLIELLGVKQLEDHDLAKHHILPAIAAMSTDVSDEASAKWRDQIRFLATHVKNCGASCALRPLIRQSMMAITCAGRVVQCHSHESLLVVVPSTSEHLEACTQWLYERFAAATGAFDVVALDKLSDVDNKALRALWTDCCELPELLDPTNPHASDALGHVVEWIEQEADLARKQRVSAELARHVDSVWTSEIADTNAWWQRGAWLEGSDGRFYRPRDLWVASPSVVALFSPSMVPVTKRAFASASLCRAWELKTTPTVDDVLSVLKTLRNDVDVAHVARLYAFLLDQSRRDDVPTSAAVVRKAFASAPLVFLPSHDDSEGRFVGVSSVVWSSAGSAIVSVATALEAMYPKTLRPFFVGVCGVERKPTIEQLQSELRAQLHDAAAMSVRQWRLNVLPLLEAMTKALAKGKLSSTQLKALKKILKSVAWIPTAAADKQLTLCSMKRSKERVVAFAEDDADCEIQRLVTSLASADVDVERVADFVSMDDAETLRGLGPLLQLVGAVSVHESLFCRAAAWCRWLAALGAATSDDRRRRKKYEKLLKKIIGVWAADRANDALSDAFVDEVSTQRLFPSHGSDALARGVDLFVNDQLELRPEQLEHPSLAILSLFGADVFVDRDADASRVHAFLLETARLRSLAQHLHTDVVVLGTSRDATDDSFTQAFSTALRLAQRVVLHQHSAVYARLDHARLHDVLSRLRLVDVVGDARALQLVHRVSTTDFSLRLSVACFVDSASHRVLVTTESDSPTRLLDVLRDVCRQCMSPSIATSVANVLYLASMQPTPEARETWLVTTQNVPPLDARAGSTLWVDEDVAQRASAKRERETEEVEDGEVAEDDDAKRPKHTHAWDSTQSTAEPLYPPPPPSSSSAWTHPPPYAPQYYPTTPYPSTNAPAALSFAGNGLSDDEKLAIGRWGEEYVYLQLTAQYAGRADVRVEWVNATDESGLPYDIVVTTGASRDVEYVEVKATKTMEKGVFEISMNELDQAMTHGSRYVIYRVFNAGDASRCRVVRMKNPVALVRQKKMALVLMMQ